MRIAIFGGSFDPIHTGHAMLVNAVSQTDAADEVWIMVSPQNPLKQGRKMTDFAHRLAMAELVAEKCHAVKASGFEDSLPRPSYTYLTLCRLREHYPEHRFTLLIGSDNWNIFHSWRDYEGIIREFGVLVYQRPDCPVSGELPEGVKLIADVPMTLLSSTMIRRYLAEDKNVNFMLPAEVLEYINENGLYRPEEERGSERSVNKEI